MVNPVLAVQERVKLLRAALSQEDDEQIDVCLPALQRSLLDDEQYRAIWDERCQSAAHVYHPWSGDVGHSHAGRVCQNG